MFNVELQRQQRSRVLQSRQQFVDQIARHIRQPIVPPRVAVRQLRVVQPHQVQDRGVEVVDVERLLDDLECDRYLWRISASEEFSGRRLSLYIDQSRHAFSGEQYITSIRPAHEIHASSRADGFRVRDQHLVCHW